jgi:Uma2 family endonuclease
MDGKDYMLPALANRLTYDDFVNFPDDGLRHELIDGVHYVTPSPVIRHQRVSRDLLVALDTFLKSTDLGEVFSAPLDVVFSYYDVVEPDLLVVLADQSEIVTDKHVSGAPAIVIEILSPGTRRRDEGIKRQLYERCGVREYWIVDADRDLISIERPNEAGPLVPVGQLTASQGNHVVTPLLPGFSLSLSTLFRSAR